MTHSMATDKAPAPIGPYSQAVLAGDHLYCSGQIALDPSTGVLVGSSAAQQAEQALRNVGAILEAAGLDYSSVAKTTIFLADMNDFTAVNEVYAKYFNTAKPARSTIAVSGLPKGALVEIEAIAFNATA